MMSPRPLSRKAGVLVVLILFPLLLIAGGILTESLEPQGRTITSPPHLYLTVGFNFTTGEDQYFPANFSVPVDVDVILSITNYDNGTNPVSNSLGQVSGVVGGVAIINGQTTSSIPGSSVSHTFTITSLGLNVPLPPSSTVTFTLLIESPGVYQWHCMAPCDTNAMATPGFMQGTVTVS
jgi:hypothetical protein